MKTDPVCKVNVDDEATPYNSEYDGDEYYFCNKECKKEFVKNPLQYVIPSIETY